MSKKDMPIIKEMIRFSNPSNPNLSKDLSSCNIMVTNNDIDKILKHYNKNKMSYSRLQKIKKIFYNLKIKHLKKKW